MSGEKLSLAALSDSSAFVPILPMRLIDFAVAINMAVYSTGFQHLDIYKATWLSLDRSTTKQIDQIVIEERHVFSALYVRTFKYINIDSNHCLVVLNQDVKKL